MSDPDLEDGVDAELDALTCVDLAQTVQRQVLAACRALQLAEPAAHAADRLDEVVAQLLADAADIDLDCFALDLGLEGIQPESAWTHRHPPRIG
jgi:hypothetical protein